MAKEIVEVKVVNNRWFSNIASAIQKVVSDMQSRGLTVEVQYSISGEYGSALILGRKPE